MSLRKYGHRFSGSPALSAAFAHARVPRMQLPPMAGADGTDVILDQSYVPVWDQGQIGSCVAHAGLACLAYSTRPPFSPSRLLAYYHARLDHGEQCVDDGTWPHVLVMTLAALGVCDESRWPYDESKVFERPTDFAEQGAYDHRITSGHALDGGASLLDDIEASLRAGVPVFGGWSIDQAFEDYTGGVYDGPGATALGGHSLAIWGCRRRPDGEREWLIRNSWGVGWGLGGYLWASSRFVESGGDFCVFGGA